MSARLLGTVFFAGVYLALTASVSLANVSLSLIIGGVVALATMPARRVAWALFPGAALASLRFVRASVIDVFRCGIRVGKIVLSPSLPINPGIAKVPSHTTSTVEQAISAHAITITPGEMVVEIVDGTMVTHCLNINPDPTQLEREQIKRIVLIKKITAPFATPERKP